MRRRALLAASQMTGGGQPDTPSKDEWDYLTIIPEDNGDLYIYPYKGTNDLFLYENYEYEPFYFRYEGEDWEEGFLVSGSGYFGIYAIKNVKIQIKSYGVNFDPTNYIADSQSFRIYSDVPFKVSGTPMSVVYGDDFRNNNFVPDYKLEYLFSDSLVSEILNPETFLPYTEVGEFAYYYLFSYCEGLINAPVLPATTLTQGCYSYMFNECPKINYIKMLATDISAEDCLYDWVSGVSPTGTFVKHPEATWEVRGVNGVPEDWTIKFDGEEDLEPYDRMFKIDDSWTQISENEYYFTMKFPSEAIVFQQKANVVLNKYGKTQQTGNTIVKYCENVPSSFNVTVDGIRMKELRFTYIDSNFQYATMEGNEGNVNISMEVDSESFTLYKSLY